MTAGVVVNVTTAAPGISTTGIDAGLISGNTIGSTTTTSASVAVAPQSRMRSADRLAALHSEGRQPIRAELPNVRDGGANTAVIRLYDPIDSWGERFGVSAKEFTSVLDELPDTVEEIRLLINSPGGEVFEGIAIVNALRSHPARVVAVVEGLAASAASFLAVAVDELVMAKNSELMIHDAWGVCVGNAEDMRDLAEDLDRLSNNIASIYADKAGGDLATWRAAMERETWYSAQEALEAGLADRIDGGRDGDQPKNRFDLSIFNFAGRRHAPSPQASAIPPSSSPSPGQEGASMPDLTEIRDALGLADDASDEEVMTAALDRLTAPSEPTNQLPEGVVTIDAAQLEELRTQASAGVEARNEQMRQRREHLVNAAVADGRIAPARREAWLAQLEADTGAEQVLASLEKGLIPVDPKGSNGEIDLESDDALYAQLYVPQEATR